MQVSSYIEKKWDEKLPLWSVAYIPNYRDNTGARSAMVSRGHHTQADGQGFILSALYVTSYGRDLQKMMDEGGSCAHSKTSFTKADSERLHLLWMLCFSSLRHREIARGQTRSSTTRRSIPLLTTSTSIMEHSHPSTIIHPPLVLDILDK